MIHFIKAGKVSAHFPTLIVKFLSNGQAQDNSIRNLVGPQYWSEMQRRTKNFTSNSKDL
jgi:hypothetical protein